jgi:hypothetical protein
MAGHWMASPSDKYGGSIAAPSGKATPDATAVTTGAPVVTPSLAGMLSPSDPMFWFGVIAAGAVGLMAYSTVTTD